jgi:hypothetical protein
MQMSAYARFIKGPAAAIISSSVYDEAGGSRILIPVGMILTAIGFFPKKSAAAVCPSS